ncbi:MAG: DNA polymerase III subunit delta [Acutalibacter sp.]|nr:DNA polymerase III subunit delta [Acutalibacter sp.]
MPEITETELKQQLAGGIFSRLYLIAGEEKYLVKRAAGRILKKAESEPFPEFNSHTFTNEAEIDSIFDAAQAAPFFAEHKCVAVADFDVEGKNSSDLKKLYELLDETPDTTSLVFWYPTLQYSDEKKAKKWQEFQKTVREKGTVVLCKRRTEAELQKMLLREAEKAGCVLSKRNTFRIMEYAGQDVTGLLHEMEKLCAYALGQAAAMPSGENPPEITAEMIEELVPKTMETQTYRMADALVAGNYEKAYELLDLLFYQKEKAVNILGSLSSAYVDMYRVQAALESGKRAVDAQDYGSYYREFPLRNAERNVRKIKPEALRKSLDLLLEADMALKGSRLSDQMILERLIAKLLLAAKGERTP